MGKDKPKKDEPKPEKKEKGGSNGFDLPDKAGGSD
jgi:hypothetical protein